MRARRRQVEDEVDLVVLDQVVDREPAQPVLGGERLRRRGVEIGAGDRPPPLERHRVPDVASADDPAADDADAKRLVGHVARIARTAWSDRSTSAKGSPLTLSCSTMSHSTPAPNAAGSTRS